MESSPQFTDPTLVEKGVRSREANRVREALFAQAVTERIIGDVEVSMLDADFSETDVEAFEASLANYSDTQIKQILSIPWEIRERRFAALRKTGKTAEEITQELLDDAERNGFTIGYHLSPNDIEPRPIKGRSQEAEWCIDESELDDRDDRKMAYYSLDYENLFRKKIGKYLYVVRAHTGEQTSHKRDGNNNWGRATKLSIVSKLDIGQIDADVERKFAEYQTQRKTPPTM